MQLCEYENQTFVVVSRSYAKFDCPVARQKFLLLAAVHVKLTYSGGPLDSQTWQTEWKTAPLAKVQLYEYENQTLEAFVADSRSLFSGLPEFFTFSYCACETNLFSLVVQMFKGSLTRANRAA